MEEFRPMPEEMQPYHFDENGLRQGDTMRYAFRGWVVAFHIQSVAGRFLNSVIAPLFFSSRVEVVSFGG